MNNPFFSICIPVYNVEKYLEECIDSVLNQDEQDFEIILCDDGSTDNSGNICDNYKEKYPDKIKVIHKENEGQFLTRSLLLQNSNGNYIVFIDSDDYVLPKYLSTVKQYLIKNNADMAILKIIYGKEDINDFTKTSIIPFVDGQIFEGKTKSILYNQFLIEGYLNAIYQKVFDRNLIKKSINNKNWNTVSVGEDCLQSLQLIDNAKKVIFLDKAFYYYRFNPNSITHKNNFETLKKTIYSYIEVGKACLFYANKWNFSKNQKEKICCIYLKLIALNIYKLIKLKDKKTYILLDEIKNNDFIKTAYTMIDQKELGNKNKLLYLLLMKKLFFLILFLK